MMFDSTIALMRATALHAALLSAGAQIPAIPFWRARCCTLVETLQQEMQDRTFPATDIREISLAQCVLLDELTLHALPSRQHEEWLRDPLQARFHGVRDGAARVWERIDAVVNGGRQDVARFEFYSVLLELGFDGGRENVATYLERMKSALSSHRRGTAVLSIPDSAETALFASNTGHTEQSNPDGAFAMIYVDRYRAALIWITVSIAGLIWLGLPLALQPGWPVVLGLVLLTALGAAVLPAYGQRRETHEDEDIHIGNVRELLIVLVIGPHAGALFARDGQASTLRRNGDAVWLPVRTPQELSGVITTVMESHQRPPDAVLMPLVPDGDCDDAVIRREFSRWKHELDASIGPKAFVLPCYFAIYACLGSNGDPAVKPVWIGNAIDISAMHPATGSARKHVQALREQLDQAWLTAAHPERASRAGLGHAVFDWLEDAALLSILSSLANTAPFSLRGLLLADIGHPPMRPGAWTRWLTGKTGLRPPLTTPKAHPKPLSLPPLATVARKASVRLPKARWYKRYDGALHTVAASACVLMVSIGVSAWSNSRLVTRVANDLDAYTRIPAASADAKRERFESLRRQSNELARYASGDVPTGIGWDLYRGNALQIALEQATATWHSPSIATHSPLSAVTIDNLSLFDSGKTTLKSGAEPRLNGVLDLIRANPDKRIVIAGHTDNVGPSAANQALSEARARAIRDWFVNSESLPVTRFAIQGYGDTRPIASNASSQGRETNRRVEITLVPDSSTR
ncbi:DotU family type IV/VI secretion system protein [Paraburkholderia sp. HP33-1]|uniref:DotU family type IV/VI secretion system protein n=1 Tax=Paraburkholderia sp. HP33-1 TaxID=2883243 RepID=UPI001F45384C|nr:DotU family type IV/VI secretion system protein [Paraburkholderia sp. HP33-1]